MPTYCWKSPTPDAMPIDYNDYPENWHEISRRIRFERAQGCCEWCGAVNGAALPSGWKVVLTVAHLGVVKLDGTAGDKHDKHDCRDENLAALCQRCHLSFDHPDHVAHARATRRAKQLAKQPEFFSDATALAMPGAVTTSTTAGCDASKLRAAVTVTSDVPGCHNAGEVTLPLFQ